MAAERGPVVTAGQLVKQAIQDWGGKEVQTGYTLTYVWMANQLGHVALGFLPTFVLIWLWQWFVSLHLGCCTLAGFKAVALALPWDQPPQYTAALDMRPSAHLCLWLHLLVVAQILIWIWKEWRDVRIATKDAAGNPFPLEGHDLLLDAATAILFISFGVGLAYVSFWSWFWAFWLFVAELIAFLFPAYYWLSRKFCFQRATLPFLFRLSDVTSALSGSKPDAVKQVLDFISGRGGHHLLVFGDIGSGRTSFAASILTEHCFKVNRGRYLTWSRFIENAQSQPEPAEQDGRAVWLWRQADIVVLDDVVKSFRGLPPELAPVVTELTRLSVDVRKDLANRRTVWVLGPTPAEDVDKWIAALAGALNTDPTTFEFVRMAAGARRDRRKLYSRFLGH